MSVTAEFTIMSEEFTLGRALAQAPGMRIELERVVPVTEEVMPFFWAFGGDRETFERVLTETAAVESVTVLDELDDRVLYRAKWAHETESLVYGIAEAGATILEAVGTSERWHFQLRFPDREAVSEFDDYCAANDIGFRLTRLGTDSEREQYFGLTDEQRRTLLEALDAGYFNVPRDVSQSELADRLGVSGHAVSERLRRATGCLVENALLPVAST